MSNYSLPEGLSHFFLEFEESAAVRFVDNTNSANVVSWGTLSIYTVDPGNPAFTPSDTLLEDIEPYQDGADYWYIFPKSIVDNNTTLVFVFEAYDGQKQTNIIQSNEFSETTTITGIGNVTVRGNPDQFVIEKWIFQVRDPFDNYLTSHLLDASVGQDVLNGLTLGLEASLDIINISPGPPTITINLPTQEMPAVSSNDYQDNTNKTWGWFGLHRHQFVYLLKDAIDGVGDYFGNALVDLTIKPTYESFDDICAIETNSMNDFFYKYDSNSPDFYASALANNNIDRRKIFQEEEQIITETNLSAWPLYDIQNRPGEQVGFDREYDIQVRYQNGIKFESTTGANVSGTIEIFEAGNPGNVFVGSAQIRDVAIGQEDFVGSSIDPCRLFENYSDVTVRLTPNNPDDFDVQEVTINVNDGAVGFPASDGVTYRSFYVFPITLNPCTTPENKRISLGVSRKINQTDLGIPKDIAKYKASKKGNEILKCLFDAYRSGNDTDKQKYIWALHYYRQIAIIKALVAEGIKEGSYTDYATIESEFCLKELQKRVRCYGIDVKQEILSVPEFKIIRAS